MCPSRDKVENGYWIDLVAEVKVMVPKELSEEERNLFEKLNKVSSFDPRNK